MMMSYKCYNFQSGTDACDHKLSILFISGFSRAAQSIAGYRKMLEHVPSIFIGINFDTLAARLAMANDVLKILK